MAARVARDPGEGVITSADLELTLEGALDAEQRQRLREISARCPIHRTLQAGVRIGDR